MGVYIAEARGAKNSSDFIHKRGFVLKELNEPEVWIDMLVRRKMAEDQLILQIQEECKSLSLILTSVQRPCFVVDDILNRDSRFAAERYHHRH
jgi:four helix bundle protein